MGDNFFDEAADEGERIINDEGRVFGVRFVEAILGIYDECREGDKSTPPPVWLSAEEFQLEREVEFQRALAGMDERIEALKVERNQVAMQATEFSAIKNLLFEKGNKLEAAVRAALQELGFEASHFKSADSEFDAVFTDEQARFIGEVEGKDTKPINVDKISQLERNLNEDFEREDVKEHARGVLFGNAYRVLPPIERPEAFTDKVRRAAQRTGILLVRTSELFRAVKYVRDSGDLEYAAAVRQAFKEGAGELILPAQPKESELPVP